VEHQRGKKKPRKKNSRKQYAVEKRTRPICSFFAPYGNRKTTANVFPQNLERAARTVAEGNDQQTNV
jgi:hypothetical protein